MRGRLRRYPHAPVETLAEAVLHRLSRRDEMPDEPVVLRPGEHGVRGELGPIVRDDHAWPAAPFDQAVSSRATRRPEIEVSGIAARHSRVTSSTMLRIRNRRPQASWSWTKSTDQQAFGLDSTRIGGPDPTARLRA